MYTVPNEVVAKRLGVPNINGLGILSTINKIQWPQMNGPWVAGGAIRRIFTGEEQNSDIDYFFRNEEQFEQAKTSVEAAGGILRGRNDMNHSYVIPAAEEIVLSEETGDETPFKNFVAEQKVQLIHFRFYNNPAEVLDSFDYTLSQFLWDGSYFHFGDFALFDVARKKLVPHKVTYGVSTLRRMLKYTDQGYTICAGGLGDILRQVAEEPSVINQEVLYID